MKKLFILSLLFSGYGFSQSQTDFQKQYVLEGVIVKGSNYEAVPFMVLKNAELGISAISDDRGYYSISFPLSYFKVTSLIQIDLEKTGQKAGKFWITYNPADSNAKGNIVWNYDLKFIRILERDTNIIYHVTSHRRIRNDYHGYLGIQDALYEYTNSSKKSEQMSQLMADNQHVLFKLNHKYVLGMQNSIIWLDKEKLEVYVNGKRVKLKNVNKLVKRSEVQEDRKRYHEENKDPQVYKWFLIPTNLHPDNL
ncbi:MAG TPA: hypothetical protein VMY77_11130 [Chitinophagaceae bacterium]|nr:hypothetical protein [Chitinophagaceae bacterium]